VSAKRQPRHKYAIGAELKIVKDLSGNEPEVVGLEAQVKDLLPVAGRYPQYKVVIFGDKTGKVRWGV
jgi:hypothetical protein